MFRNRTLTGAVLACAVAVGALAAAVPAAPVSPSAVVAAAVPAGSPAMSGLGIPRTAGPSRYVALGDSAAAAPGVPRQVDLRCLRSDHNYPALVAARLRPVVFSDRTCSGATTADLARDQFTALRPDTSLVTLTVGANDIGFAQLALQCTLLGALSPAGAPCRAAHGSDLDPRITAAASKVTAALRTVHRLSPRAQVLLVGYLNLIPDDHRGCRPRELFGAGDLAYLDGIENRLNTALAGAARAAGAVFVDDHPVSAAHDICRPSGVRWTEALLPTRATVPFHPNASGEAAMAGQVLATVAR